MVEVWENFEHLEALIRAASSSVSILAGSRQKAINASLKHSFLVSLLDPPFPSRHAKETKKEKAWLFGRRTNEETDSFLEQPRDLLLPSLYLFFILIYYQFFLSFFLTVVFSSKRFLTPWFIFFFKKKTCIWHILFFRDRAEFSFPFFLETPLKMCRFHPHCFLEAGDWKALTHEEKLRNNRRNT